MKIIDIHPTHYVLGTDDGRTMHVARTPGVEALMLAQHPGRHDLHDSKPRSAYKDDRRRHDGKGLADGGIVSPWGPGGDPEAGLTEQQQADLAKQRLADWEKSHSVVVEDAGDASITPTTPNTDESQPSADEILNFLNPAPAPAAPARVDPAEAQLARVAPPTPAFPRPGAQTDPHAAMIHNEAPAVQALPVPAGTPDRAQPATPPQPPAPSALDTLNADILQKGEHGAAAQDAATDVLRQRTRDIAARGPAPSPAAIDPGQFYANVGRGLGFKSPQAQRIMGGIAMGLMNGLGEIGAALSHRENGAAKIIQSAIQENIAAQNANNQLTRQQWADQTNYMTDLANAKIQELASTAKSPEIRDNAKLLVDQNNLAAAQQALVKGALKPPEAIMVNKFTTALAGLESIQARMEGVSHGLSAALLNGPMETYFGAGDPRTIEMATEMAAVNMAVRQAMTPFASRMSGGSESPEELADVAKQVNEMALSVKDTKQRTQAKLAAIQRVIARNATLFRAAASGQDSTRAVGGNGMPPGVTPAP